MFKIIQFNATDNNLYLVNHSAEHYPRYNWYELKNTPILESKNFEKTLAGIGSTEILDVEKRSSWTHKLKFSLDPPFEAILFFNQNNILNGKDDLRYELHTLLKYEPGDFFLNHRDTDLTDDSRGITHQYTCLIFCPYGEDNEILEGGELIFKHCDGLYEIKFDPSIETKKNHFVMVIFSIDMYHEVLPVISGSRWVFKRPLFVKTSSILSMSKEDSEDELCDGGGAWFNEQGDY
jgi:hypothetical protein